MNYLNYFIESEIVLKDYMKQYGLSEQALRLFFICKVHFQKKETDLISVILLKKSGFFANSFNHARTLKELSDKGLLSVYPQARKNLYRISHKGLNLINSIEWALMEVD